MKHRLWRIAIVPPIVLLLGLALAAALSVGAPQAAEAQAGTGIVRVAKSGADSPGCGSIGSPCQTIQYGVDEASDGDEVLVAEGTYTGTQAAFVPGPQGSYTVTQVVLITKSLTLHGGYATADWATSVPTQNVTIIDAEGYGRGVSIVGNGTQSVTVDGFTITGGDYTGLGNPPGEGYLGCQRSGGDCAGGLFARDVTIVVRWAVISGNVSSRSRASSDGGGMFLWDARAGSRVEDTLIMSNTSAGEYSDAGGAAVIAEEMVIVRSSFIDNYATDNAGGLFLDVWEGPSVIEDCEFTGNRTSTVVNGYGGALRITGSPLLRRNRFVSNAGQLGGAIFLFTYPDRLARLDANVIVSNTAEDGGGIYLDRAATCKLTNNVIALNSASRGGGAAYVWGGGHSVWTHNTIADNDRDGWGQALVFHADGTVATLTNNIIVTHAYAVFARDNARVVVDYTLLFDNDVDMHTQDGATISSTNEITGSAPLFVDPAGWDYHLQGGSPAIDAGADNSLNSDVDGDYRPDNCAYDIGADEYVTGSKCRHVYLPLVLR